MTETARDELGDMEVPVLHDLVRIAISDPHRPAVICQANRLSYGKLVASAGVLATVLRAHGVTAGDRVVVLQAPSPAMLVTVVGVLAVGAAYVPVDPAQPHARVRDVVADARATVVVSDLDVSSQSLGAQVVSTAEGAHESAEPQGWAHPDPDSGAYVIYTSGSTGEPKGVVVNHRQLAYSTSARRQVYSDSGCFLLVSPLAFDSSIAGIWSTLTTGGCLVVVTEDERRDPAVLAALICRFAVTRTLMIPWLYRMVLEAARPNSDRDLSSLKTVIVAGELLDDALIRAHFAALPHTELVNEYGPTEATVWTTYQRYTAPGPSSIGGPIPGARVHVLDEQLRAVAPGSAGELYIAGPGVATGYLNRPDATAASFLPDPWGEPGERMYRSGDLARWNDRGELEFLGRADRQVKVRGQRVQLEAVEAALRSLDGVVDAAVQPDREHTSLIAHVQLAGEADVSSLRAAVEASLPAEHRPGRFHVHDHFPVTVNGKVDVAALERAALAAPTNEQAGAVGLTAQVLAAWQEVLHTNAVPLDANFFDVGGNSLAMMKLQGALERHTGRHATVVSLFRHTTVAAQAKALADDDTGSADRSADRAARRARGGRTRRQRLEGEQE